MPLLQLMVLVKYLGVTLTAARTNFSHVFCSCIGGSAFLKPFTATETNLVAPVAVAVATRQFGRKIANPVLKIRKKMLKMAKKISKIPK